MAKKKKPFDKAINIDYSKAESYDYHNPVFFELSLDFLIKDTEGVYVDGTLGGGGHTAGILSRLSKGGELFSFDKDPEAISHCANRFSDELNDSVRRLNLVNSSFSEACSILQEAGHDRLNGFLLDLGVSSKQLDSGYRGISHRFDGPLDMRFGTEGQTVDELIDESGYWGVEKALRLYGEEPFSDLLARRIVEARRAGSLSTTKHLKELIEETVIPKYRVRTLSRVFQGLRIAVNDELNILEKTIASLVPILRIGGRAVIITYHSLEERIVRDAFKELSRKSRPAKEGEDTSLSLTVKLDPLIKLVTKKPIKPDRNELEKNPRSRSAALWVAERI
ncbi:MAG: 16S rRNA (cytosine(1402)-N(4))-methyltransferase RsmH [Candidatus Kapaibacteriales bacterium]